MLILLKTKLFSQLKGVSVIAAYMVFYWDWFSYFNS